MISLNQQLCLPDGRRLGYNEYGSPTGTPLFHFHGAQTARVEFELFGSDSLMISLGIRLIAADRPAMGLSNHQPGRRLLDWPNDVSSFADHLSIERFSVLAYSLGGPFWRDLCLCTHPAPDQGGDRQRAGLFVRVSPGGKNIEFKHIYADGGSRFAPLLRVGDGQNLHTRDNQLC